MRALGRRHLLVALGLLCAAAANAGAATITAASAFLLPGASTGSLGPLGVTPDPNNDNAGAANPNAFASTVFMNTFGTADYEFQLAPSGGTTEYRFTQTLINNSGQNWVGYRFELGFGTGASFAPSGLSDLLDFDTPDVDPTPTSSVFAALSHQPDVLEWTGGTVGCLIGCGGAPPFSVLFTLAFDVPDGLSAFNPSGLDRFTLRQTPLAAAVPEPAMLLLMGGGLAGLIVRRRWQASHS